MPIDVAQLNRDLQRYLGPGAQVQVSTLMTPSADQYLLQGETEIVHISGNNLMIRFRWLGRKDNDRWFDEPDLDYSVSLLRFGATSEADKRLVLLPRIPVHWETLIFFPPRWVGCTGSELLRREEVTQVA